MNRVGRRGLGDPVAAVRHGPQAQGIEGVAHRVEAGPAHHAAHGFQILRLVAKLLSDLADALKERCGREGKALAAQTVLGPLQPASRQAGPAELASSAFPPLSHYLPTLTFPGRTRRVAA